MKLWDELTEKEQTALIELFTDIGKILEVHIFDPLIKLIEDLSFFFLALEGLLEEQKYQKIENRK